VPESFGRKREKNLEGKAFVFLVMEGGTKGGGVGWVGICSKKHLERREGENSPSLLEKKKTL